MGLNEYLYSDDSVPMPFNISNPQNTAQMAINLKNKHSHKFGQQINISKPVTQNHGNMETVLNEHTESKDGQSVMKFVRPNYGERNNYDCEMTEYDFSVNH